MSFYFIGDDTTLVGYRFAGINGVAANTQEEALQAFEEALLKTDISVLLLTDLVCSMLESQVTKQRMTGKPPYIVIVKDYKQTTVPRKSLENLIYEAVGIRLTKDEETPPK